MKAKRITTAASGALAAALLLTAAAADGKLQKSRENNFEPAKVSIAVQETYTDTDGSSVTDSGTDAVKSNTLLLTASTDDINIDDATYTAEKVVSVANTASKTDSSSADVFVRVCILPRWVTEVVSENADSPVSVDVTNNDSITQVGEFPKSFTGSAYEMGDITFTLAEDWKTYWIYGGDGYFYYREALAPGETTATLLESVTVSKETYDAIAEKGIGLVVDVLSDSIQTEGQDSSLGETSAVATRWGTENVVVDVENNNKLTEAE